jgi:hypothetical protein
MFRPLISQLIERLERVKEQHGDIEVQGFAEDKNIVFDNVDAEFNNDEGSFCLIVMEEVD